MQGETLRLFSFLLQFQKAETNIFFFFSVLYIFPAVIQNKHDINSEEDYVQNCHILMMKFGICHYFALFLNTFKKYNT